MRAPYGTGPIRDPTSVRYTRCTVDLTAGAVAFGDVACRNLEDVLGGFGRSFQLLAEHTVTDAYASDSPLVVNTGILTGSNVMTGLRAYFSAYSPLKVSNAGLPSAMWSAGSGKFGSKLRWTGVDEIVIAGRSAQPVVLVLRATNAGPSAVLVSAAPLLGLECFRKILALQPDYPDAHFAVIGPAGEHFDACYFGAVALSTENLLKTGDDKCRWAGRGGMGSVMGSKNLVGIVAQAPDHVVAPSPQIRALNKDIATGPGSRKFREANRGGLGGTWANYEPLSACGVAARGQGRPARDGLDFDWHDDRLRPRLQRATSRHPHLERRPLRRGGQGGGVDRPGGHRPLPGGRSRGEAVVGTARRARVRHALQGARAAGVHRGYQPRLSVGDRRRPHVDGDLHAARPRTGPVGRRKQGYERADYTLPAEVFDRPNPALEIEPFITREFFGSLSEQVWAVFDREIADLERTSTTP